MTSAQDGAIAVPQWDVADRLRKAMRVADVGVAEMAEYFDVSRNSVSAWINGRVSPKTQVLRLWAMRCGVPFEWLKDGVEFDGPGGGNVAGRGPLAQSVEQRTFNPKFALAAVA